MTPGGPDRGSALVLALAVVTALAVTTASVLDIGQVVLRRERSAWSAVVAWSDAQSLGTVVLDGLRRHPTASCSTIRSWPLPSLDHGSQLMVGCSQGPPLPWNITVSATHERRSVHVVLNVGLTPQGRPVVHRRSLLTTPNPALTNAA